MSSPIEGNVGIVTFVAEHDYEPQDEGEIDLRKGDLIVVAKPIIDPCGWLTGTNKNTGDYGQIPGTFVSIVEDYTPPPPPRPPKPANLTKTTMMKAQAWSSLEINNHDLEKVVFGKPVWCTQCHDYIWGFNKSCFWCNECCFASHTSCSYLFGNTNCDPERKVVVDYQKTDLLRPVKEWDVLDVLEWLAAIRAYQYMQSFKAANINGAALYEIDESYLKKVLGIPHDFDIRSLLISIKELTRGSERIDFANPLHPYVPEPEENFRDACRDAIQSHVMTEHTFTTIQACDICQKFMFGLVRQGFICTACGIQCHRYCAQYGLTTCKQKYYRSRRSSDVQEPSFGTNLDESVPLTLKNLVMAIEEQGMSTKDLYLTGVPFLELLSLRNALNQAPNCVNMRGSEWRNPYIAASLLKQYLLEMPLSVIPPESHEDFILAAKLSQSLQSGEDLLHGKIQKLPKRNRECLEFIQRHLIKICKSCDASTLEKMFTVFSVLILRPSDNNARTFVVDLEHHKTVMALLIGKTPDPKPAVPGRTKRVSLVSDRHSNLDAAEWYWGPISREVASEKLRNTPDGTFLVRDSTNKGEYTLTLRKGGGNKLVRIFQKDGKVGFTDSTTFPSLQALIEYYFTHSLREYNLSLDTKLLYPVSKYENLPDIPSSQLEQELQEVSFQLGRFTALENKLNETYKELEDSKELLDAQAEVIYVIEDQLSLTHGLFDEVAPEDRSVLNKTAMHLNGKLELEKRALREADECFRLKSDEYATIEKTLNDMKYDISDVKKRYNALQSKLMDSNPDRAKEFHDKENEGIYDELPALSCQREIEELPQDSWLLGKVTRDEVRRLLNGKPDGTFFVRASERRPGFYVISLVHDQSIKHIPIERGPRGYGFAEPYNIYVDLKSLVHHYHKQSLKMHNPSLDTTLMFPIRYIEDDDNIYMAFSNHR
ncbi:phosphatidylinositol 3-kinase regulatory subunit alpha-like [Rhopilema esculentum]|uniref:phosphatidylinositol 3-kinase regulatory subunit alpha-like n=1 Tax=Rhopilema esculentum TaxID=499914 RepID=UPI0031D70287|eukprot:gene4656-20937_t